MESSDNSGFRSGYVSIVGRPNVGKSTLLNNILGDKIAIVTSRPQTTRNRIIGVRTTSEAQIVFIDTPGIHRPRERLGEFMMREARAAVKEVDIILLMVEPHLPRAAEKQVLEILKDTISMKPRPLFLLINKIDLIRKPELLLIIDAYRGLYDFEEIIPISALKGDGVDRVVNRIIEYLPEGPKYYPDDMLTDQLERFMASEMIREKIMSLTEDEIPYSVAVEIINWEEKSDIIIIEANIYVEKESQKGIIIGKKGGRLKKIGTLARQDIERLLNTKVYLELWVKVKEDWRDRPGILKELGYR